MKLHAIITNDNGTTVSKGGNEKLTIGLNVGNKNIATVELTEKDIKIWHNDGHYWNTDIKTSTTQQDKEEVCMHRKRKYNCNICNS